MYAPQPLAVPHPVSLKLIGVLDGDLVRAFCALERGTPDFAGSTVIVDVRDLQVREEDDMDALADAIRTARAQGRDVRLDARSVPWRRVLKKNLSAQPPVDPQLRSDVRRTVIMAHSAQPSKRLRM